MSFILSFLCPLQDPIILTLKVSIPLSLLLSLFFFHSVCSLWIISYICMVSNIYVYFLNQYNSMIPWLIFHKLLDIPISVTYKLFKI